MALAVGPIEAPFTQAQASAGNTLQEGYTGGKYTSKFDGAIVATHRWGSTSMAREELVMS